MILTEKFEIIINNRNINFYKNLGYDIKLHDNICGLENEICYVNLTSSHNVTYNTTGKYYCKKCCNETRKKTQLLRYGVENISQREDIREQRREEMKSKKRQLELKNGVIKKYGVNNISKLNFIKEKKKETTVINYGVENPSQSEDIKIRKENTCEINYGVKHPLQNKEIFKKMLSDNTEKYGFEWYTQTDEYIAKVNKTCNKKYNTDWYLQSDDVKEKGKKTCLEKYGVEHPSQSEIILEKSRNTRIKNGHETPEYKLTEYQIYRKKVRHYTYKNKKKLYEKWNGYDYYDNEFIKNNNDYNKNDYPSIDHKTSIIYGFINDITPEEISKLENLCITKRILNSSKGNNNEITFKNKINNNEKII
jgi:hypothetical protein